MSDTMKPVIPALARHYPAATDWSYLLLRVTAGLMLIPHVWPKLMVGPAAVAANVMTRRGVEPALAAAYVTIIVEVLGAICITLGVLVRPVALLLVIEFIVIVKVHSVAGWGVGGGGAEFAFLWLIVYVYILCRGAGPYSLARVIGRQI